MIDKALNLLVALGLDPSGSCSRTLTLDDHYVSATDTAEPEALRLAATRLLGQAFLPVLTAIGEAVDTTALERMRTWARERGPADRNVTTIASISLGVVPDAWRTGYTASYAGEFHLRELFGAPFTGYSRAVMGRLLVAMIVLDRIATPLYPRLRREMLREAKHLLNERTYTKLELDQAMTFARDATLTAIAQLVADPVAGLDADALLRRVTRPERSISLITLLALRLPPRLLGRFGHFVYFPNPLRQRNGKLGLTPEFSRELDVRHDETMLLKDFELGFGCPVAHSTEGMRGLQIYVDALMRIYDVLAE